jgi:hypothetical protein
LAEAIFCTHRAEQVFVMRAVARQPWSKIRDTLGFGSVGAPPAVTQDDLQAPQRKGRELAATRDQINETIGAVKSVIGDGRTIVRSAGSDNGSNPATAGPARKTPERMRSTRPAVTSKRSSPRRPTALRRRRAAAKTTTTMGTGVRAERGKSAESTQPRSQRARGC